MMNLVSKQDIKKALSETFERPVESQTQLSIGQEKEEAKTESVPATIKNTLPGRVKQYLNLCITEYYTRLGHDMDKAGATHIDSTINILEKDLRGSMSHLRLGEIRLAMEYGAKGVFGDAKPCSASSISHYLMAYLQLHERQSAKDELSKEENEAKNAKLLTKRIEWTEAEYVEKMRERYIENLNRVAAGKSTLDIGGLLFEHLVKNEIIELTEHDLKAAEEMLLEKRKKNPFDLFTRALLERHRSGEAVLASVTKEIILNKYFKMEVDMRLMEKAKEKQKQTSK